MRCERELRSRARGVAPMSGRLRWLHAPGGRRRRSPTVLGPTGQGPARTMADASSITVPEVLELLDGPFASFSAAFERQQYVCWVGSGISRDRIPGVGELVLRVLEHLRVRARDTDPDGRFTDAF